MKKRRGDPLRIGDRRCGNIQQAELDHPVKQLAPRLADDPTHHHVTKKGDIDYRSEEHTSELQSLMRISYAVFCLKKKKTPKVLLSTRHKHKLNHTNTLT